MRNVCGGLWRAAAWLGFMAVSAAAQGELVPGLQNMGIYGGTVDRIVAAPVDGTTTRLVATFQNPNSAFWADVPVGAGDPFDPANDVLFRVVPGLAAEQNRPTPTHAALHAASLRFYANVASRYGYSISSYSTDPNEEVQEIDDMPPGPPNVNKSAWPGSLLVHGDRIAYTLAMNVGTDHTLALCLRTLDQATGLINEDFRMDVVIDTETLPSQNEPSGGFNSELAVCPSTEKLMAIFFADGAHPLFAKLLVSKSSFADIGPALDWSTAFDARNLPAYVGGWELGTARWPLRLGVAPDGRVFVAGLAGNPSTVRIAYSDDQGQTWSAEVDTGVQQGYLGPQIAFVEDGPNYYVYSSSSVSTNKGEDGSWYMTGYGMHAPCADPNDPELLYLSSDQLGLGYSTNALSTATYQDHNLADWLEIDVATYSRGIEAVEILDFDFTADKKVGWTASGQGVRWTTNLNAGATNVVWSEPIMPAPAPSYHAVAIDPNVPGGATVYVADNRHVYRSQAGFTDAADDWVRVLRSGTFDPGDNPGGYEMATVRRIGVKPGDSNMVAVGYHQMYDHDDGMTGVLFTEDHGATWTNLMFNGDQRCDVRDLLFVDGQLFVAASWNEAYPDNAGVFRIDTDNGWTVHHELDDPIKTRSLAVDSAGNVYAVGVTTNGTQYGYGGEPVAYWRPAGGTDWETMSLEGLPENPGPAQPANAYVTVGVDGNSFEAVLMTFGRGLYVMRAEGWVRIHQYPFQTLLHVLRWDELTLGSGSGLYAQDTGNLDGNVFYVSPTGSNLSPYDSWATAANEIQTALNAARGGDLVLVANGTYSSGGMEVDGLMTRVVVPEWVTLRSVNGPEFTTIVGAEGTGANAPLGPDAVRGAYVAERGRIEGFTITGGHTDFMDDDDDDEDEDEDDEDSDGPYSGGGVFVFGGRVVDCVIVSNRASLGGGVFIAGDDHLAVDGRVERCEISRNRAEGFGGGVAIMDGGVVINSLIEFNHAFGGGGVVIEDDGVVANCLILHNASMSEDEFDGSGVLMLEGGLVVNCTILFNYATSGGGAVRGIGDEDDPSVPGGALVNSIVWGSVGTNVAVGSLGLVENSCAPELTAGVDGNLNSDPLFADPNEGDYRLHPTSPCIDAGQNMDWMDEETDLDGNPRIYNAVVDMGAFEYTLVPAVLQVAPEVRLVGFVGGTVEFAVGNGGGDVMAYEAETAAPWLQVLSGGIGWDSGTVLISVEPNLGEASRSGIVTVTAPAASNSPVEVAVVQGGRPAAGRVVGWGSHGGAEIQIPDGLGDATAVAGGYAHSIALLVDGTVTAWGTNSHGQTDVPAGLSNVVAISAGSHHNLAVRSDGTAAVWGQGSGSGEEIIPVWLSNVVAVAAGYDFSMALLGDGQVVAWGANDCGQTDVPLGLSGVKAIAAGHLHGVALRANGTVAAWGWNNSGQCDVPAGLSNVVAIAAGERHTMALKADGTVAAWGENSYGQTNVPPGLANVVAIAAKDMLSMALRADGTVAAWGQNTQGQTNVPAGLQAVVGIGAGGYSGLALVGPVLAVSPTNLAENAAGGATEFDVTNSGGGTLTYEAETATPWISISSGATGSAPGTVGLTLQANVGSGARTGTVTVTSADAGAGSPAVVTVLQAGASVQAAFAAGPLSGTAPLTVSFTNQSAGEPTGWTWYFGDETYDGEWVEMTSGASWAARNGHAMVALNNGNLVLMGGFGGNSVFRSADRGENWSQAYDSSAPWLARYGHAAVALPGSVVVAMGGTVSGTEANDVWRSADGGYTWDEAVASADWSARTGHAAVALPDGSIVLMGGWDGANRLNDVWRSEDAGATWTQQTAAADWAARMTFAAVALPDGGLLVLGGSGELGDLNDVWHSEDAGATWTQQTASAGWAAREGHAAVALPNGVVLVLGGSAGIGRRNDVWSSCDQGATWTLETDEAEWSARNGHAAAVLPDGGVVVAGGWDGANANDVWLLETAGSNAENPQHEYAEAGVYSVTLFAYNELGANAHTSVDLVSAAAPVPVLVVSPTNRAVSSSAGTTTFAVTNAGPGVMAYAATTATPWLSISNGAAGTNVGVVTVGIASNGLATARTGVVTVTSAGASNSPVFVTVVQAGSTSMSPSGGETVASRRPAFSWPATPGATWYQISLNRNGQSYMGPWVEGATTWTPANDLPPGNYRWWVRSWSSAAGHGPWSAANDFVIEAALPATPTPSFPTGGQAVSNRPTFTWMMATPAATWFQVELTRNGQLLPLQWVEEQESWTPTNNLPLGNYQWRVRGWNPDGFGAWSTAETFVVPAIRPTVAPTPLYPQGTQTMGDRRPEFSWSAVSNATWYRVYASRDGQVAIDRWVEATIYAPPADLPAGTYRWWVMGWGPDGSGPWSAATEFVLPLQIPGTLTMTSPQGVQISHDLNYVWNKDPVATWYRLWVGRVGGAVLHDRWYELSGTGEASVNPGAAYPNAAKPAPSQPVGTIANAEPTFRWNGGNCEWFVRGWGPDGNGPWAGPMAFSVPYAPGTWCRVYVSRGNTVVLNQWTQAAELAAPAPLQTGAHSWWLGVWDAPTGRTIWSDRVDFVVP